jgi:hypothetical protein
MQTEGFASHTHKNLVLVLFALASHQTSNQARRALGAGGACCRCVKRRRLPFELTLEFVCKQACATLTPGRVQIHLSRFKCRLEQAGPVLVRVTEVVAEVERTKKSGLKFGEGRRALEYGVCLAKRLGQIDDVLVWVWGLSFQAPTCGGNSKNYHSRLDLGLILKKRHTLETKRD